MIEDYLTMPLTSLNTLLSRLRPFVKLLMRLIRYLELLTSKFEARTSMEVLAAGGANCYCGSLAFFEPKASCSVNPEGENCRYI